MNGEEGRRVIVKNLKNGPMGALVLGVPFVGLCVKLNCLEFMQLAILQSTESSIDIGH